MPESLSYYHREGVDYAVLPLGIDELKALVGYIPDHDGMRGDYVKALQYLERRQSYRTRRVSAILNEEDPDAIPVEELDDANPMAFSLTLLRFVQKLAAQVEGGIITAQYREEAKALLQQLAKVEARNDADRW